MVKGKKFLSEDWKVEKKGSFLEGEKVAFCICGSIASVEAVKIIREFRRQGAVIWPFMTPEARSFIAAKSISWAAASEVVGEGGFEVAYLERFDGIVLCPLTWNTLAKVAVGVADNSVTQLLAAQWSYSEVKKLLVPVMHLALEQHPLYRVYRERIEGWGGYFLEGPLEEDKRKIPVAEQVVRAYLLLKKGR